MESIWIAIRSTSSASVSDNGPFCSVAVLECALAIGLPFGFTSRSQGGIYSSGLPH